MFTNPQKIGQALFDFLFVHKHNSEQLIVNDKITNPEELSLSIDKAKKLLKKKSPDDSYSKVKHNLEEHGFVDDRQADLKVHGGPEKAVHHYASEHMEFWREMLI